MRDNTRGMRRIVRRAQAAFRPKVPFASAYRPKGIWEHFTRAPQHVWRRYEVAAPVERLLRIAVLSDLHVGSHANDVERFCCIVEEVLARKPDLCLLPGDFVNMQIFGGGRISPDEISSLLAPLARNVPCHAVLGNHDAEYGNDATCRALECVGITVHSNSHTVLESLAGSIFIFGLEDHSTGSPDFGLGAAGIADLRRAIVLARDPASFADVPEGPIVTICGHTHGGQIRLPWLGPVVNASAAPMEWTQGHIVEDGRNLIVSAGLGTSGLPWRWNCPPEIVEVDLLPLGA